MTTAPPMLLPRMNMGKPAWRPRTRAAIAARSAVRVSIPGHSPVAGAPPKPRWS